MLMSAADYRESLRRFNPVVFVNGRRIESVADDPVLAPGINAIGTTYDFAFEPEYRPLMLATQASSGREVNRMLHINETSVDLLSKLEAVRLLCKHSGCATLSHARCAQCDLAGDAPHRCRQGYRLSPAFRHLPASDPG